MAGITQELDSYYLGRAKREEGRNPAKMREARERWGSGNLSTYHYTGWCELRCTTEGETISKGRSML